MQGTFKEHAEIAKGVATAAPYKEWVNANHRLEDLVSVGKYMQETQMETAQVLRLQAANGKLCIFRQEAKTTAPQQACFQEQLDVCTPLVLLAVLVENIAYLVLTWLIMEAGSMSSNI